MSGSHSHTHGERGQADSSDHGGEGTEKEQTEDGSSLPWSWEQDKSHCRSSWSSPCHSLSETLKEGPSRGQEQLVLESQRPTGSLKETTSVKRCPEQGREEQSPKDTQIASLASPEDSPDYGKEGSQGEGPSLEH